MTLDLTSVRAKLTRSQEHAQMFKSEFAAWADRHPYSLIKTMTADSTRHSLIIRVNETPPLQRWSLIIADAFNNLRNGLDHLVYAIAVHEAAFNHPANEGKLQFPITDCRERFDEAAKGRKNLGAISLPITTAIEAAQPYNRPHQTVPPLLAILRDFTNSDKHKLLHLALASLVQGDVGFAGILPKGVDCTAIPFPGEVKDNTEIFAMVCNGPTPEMGFDRHIFEVVVAVEHGKRDPLGPDWTSRSEFGALYREISGEVRRIIYEVSTNVK